MKITPCLHLRRCLRVGPNGGRAAGHCGHRLSGHRLSGHCLSGHLRGESLRHRTPILGPKCWQFSEMFGNFISDLGYIWDISPLNLNCVTIISWITGIHQRESFGVARLEQFPQSDAHHSTIPQEWKLGSLRWIRPNVRDSKSPIRNRSNTVLNQVLVCVAL